MQQPSQIKRTVLLWVTVTMALWATLPMAMYLSHWQWFGWMPRTMQAPVGTAAHHSLHNGPPSLVINMASLLLMSGVVMAVVLWLVSMRRRDN